jgi:hypothetical protein
VLVSELVEKRFVDSADLPDCFRNAAANPFFFLFRVCDFIFPTPT